MKRLTGCRAALGLILGAMWSVQGCEIHASFPEGDDPPDRDAVLDWNAIAMQAVADDHSDVFGAAEQGGPTRTARALAIVHAAMFDAVNSIEPRYTPYRVQLSFPGASIDAAVAQAAHDTLVALYPSQAAVFDAELAAYLVDIGHGPDRSRGRALGGLVAQRILKERRNDGSDAPTPYTPGTGPGEHRPDPLNPQQGFLGAGWGNVEPFAMESGSQFRAPPPQALASAAYTAAFEEVKALGGDGITTPTARTPEQTEIGLYWAYDGAAGLGTPPRLYNQIARVIAEQEGNTEIENARLFALINIAMADAGIAAWETKYFYDVWRPILGIREADTDGNPDTEADPDWRPLGAPASNESGSDFTPPFPAYTSGHSTFGAATFGILAHFYGTDDVAFSFVSDELDGITTDSRGNVRPRVVRYFGSLSQAAEENAESRIYLGVHWRFDATAGLTQGYAIAGHVFASILRPVHP